MALHVPRAAAVTCTEKLHRLAVTTMGNIIRARRAREHACNPRYNSTGPRPGVT